MKYEERGTAPEGKLPIDAEALTKIACPCAPMYSPDGRRLVYELVTPDAGSNSYRHELRILEGGKDRPLPAGDESSCRVWLDPATLLLRKNTEPASAFFALNVESGVLTPAFSVPAQVMQIIALDGGDFALLCYYDRQAAERDPGWEEIDEIPFWGSGRGIFAGRRCRLYRYSPDAGSMEPITGETMQIEHLAGNGGGLVWSGIDYRDVYSARCGIYAYDVSERRTRCLVEPGVLFTAGLDILGERVMLLSSGNAQDDAWQPQDLYGVPFAGGGLEKLADWNIGCGFMTALTDCALGGGTVCKASGKYFYFLSSEGCRAQIFRADCQGNISRPLTQGLSSDVFDVFEDRLCCRTFFGDQGPELFENGIRLTFFGRDFAETYACSRPLPLSVVNRDSIPIDGWVIVPPDAAPGVKRPGILNIHGGPRCMYNDMFMHEMQLEAASGYYVFFCNPRGSEGRGREFGDLYGKYGSIDYNDLMDFTDGVLARYPDIDAGRLGVSGGSYGGFMTNWIIGRTDRFAAACSQRSIANWTVNEYVSEIGYYWISSEMGGDTEHDPEKLWSMSPLKYAPQAVTPTLFMQSDEDYLCPLADAAAMFTALKRRGTPAKLCIFHGENHGLSRGGRILSRLHRLGEILGWFGRYLTPER